MSISDSVPSAASYLTVANTPLFLVNKLRGDAHVISLANRLSSTELVTNIAECLKRVPSDIYEEVEPYVYLVALVIKGDIRALTTISQFTGQNYRWFAYLSNYLLRTTPVTIRTNNSIASVPMGIYDAPKYATPTKISIFKDVGR